ncbi:MAG: sodium-dependent bicarbonate transport family permease [Pseudomonadota bacterium]
MDQVLLLAGSTLTSPMILFFVLGTAAALVQSDLELPAAFSKAMALYLLFAIGFKGGASVAEHGVDSRLGYALVAGAMLSLTMPLIAFAILRAISSLDRVESAAVSAHYGSISIVTFTASVALLEVSGISSEGWLVAVAAAMEAPAIMTALLLAKGAALFATAPAGGGTVAISGGSSGSAGRGGFGELFREAALNGAIVLLIGAFVIGWITGEQGKAALSPFVIAPFAGILCLFLLDMGLAAGRGLGRSAGDLGIRLLAFGIVMPLIGAALGLATGVVLGLSVGGTAVLATLSASASYIAAPAAMRAALPEARPEIYLTLSLGVTFPFNLLIGIPLYLAAAQALVPVGP